MTAPTPGAPPDESTMADAQRIVDALHEPLIVLDAELSIRQVNPAFRETFSIPRDEAVGTALFELGGRDFDHPDLRGALASLQESGTPFKDVEIEGAFDGLGARVLRVNGQRLADGAGHSERILLAIDDITEQRRLEEDLRRQARELEQSNEDLEQFAYAASHDLQEPLRMVASYLQLLERRYEDDLDETAQEFIAYAVDGAERMKALINGLLQYSRVGRKEGEFGEVDLGVVLDDILDDLSRRIDELDGTVTRETLPCVYGNREQLRRLLQNLIDNALTYRGDAPPRIHVSGEQTPEGTHLVVRDEGPGIPPEAQDKIFQIFKQLDPHETGSDGSGMGLALSRKIAERHDGRIWVESEPGADSAFHVLLRLDPTSAS